MAARGDVLSNERCRN